MVSDRRLVAALTAALTLSLLAGAATVLPADHGVASAGHGPSAGDFTVEPMSDRSPGATNVKYGMIVVGTAGVDYATLERMTAIYTAGSWRRCGPSDSEVFGIDRGNTHPGYETDEGLQDNVKSFSAGEDRFAVEFYGEDDFGSSTHLEDGDAIVSIATCIDNPDEPGWYQIAGSTTGVTDAGERVTIGSDSHYFWICECADEAAARERLGPPPSEPQSTPTPTPMPPSEPDGSQTEGDPAGDSSGSAGTTADADAPESSPTPTAASGTPGPAPTGGSTATPTQTGRVESWDRHVIRSPTPGDGDGFGGVVGVLAILGAAVLLRNRG